MLSKEKIEIYRQILETERARLIKEVQSAERPKDFGDDTDSFEEETNEAEALSAGIGVAHAYRMRLEEIELALNSIRLGKYGICTKCGEEISEKVLDVAPESQLCESCKKKS